MNRTRIRTLISGAVAASALAIIAIGGVAQAAANDGLRNCVEITGPQSGRAGCYELVWDDGVQYRMTFSNQGFSGSTPHDLSPFYVLAPQTDAPQGYPPNTFPHDHVIAAVPAQNHGTYSVRLQGFFVLCSGQGIVSGSCVPAWTSVGGPDPLPFAQTVDGHALTSTTAIESAASAGDLALVNLGPTAVIVGSASAAR